MAETVRIRRLADNQVFEGPAGGEIPAGFEALAPTPSAPIQDPGLIAQGGEAIANLLVPPDPSQPTLLDRARGVDWKKVAYDAIPKTPSEIGGAIGAMAPAVLSAIPQTRVFAAGANTPLGRSIASGVGSALGGVAEGRGIGNAVEEGVKTGVVSGAAESLGGLGSWLVRSVAKPYINRQTTMKLLEQLYAAAPSLRPVVEGAMAGTAPTLKRTSRPAAALQETALSERGRNALGDRLERGIAEANVAGAAPRFAQQGPAAAVIGVTGPPTALGTAYGLMPQLAKDELVGRHGPISPAGFSLHQAQEILSWLGSQGFKEAPLAQGATGLPQRRLWERGIQEIEAGLGGRTSPAGQAYFPARREYAGGTGILDVVREPHAFIGEPNRVMLNERQLEIALSQRRAELVRELGEEGFQRLAASVLRGGQLGTGSRITSGAGTLLTAAMQTFGRGTNSGATGYLGVPLRTALPNVGSQYTGQKPFTIPPLLKSILDVAGQRGASRVLDPRERPVTPSEPPPDTSGRAESEVEIARRLAPADPISPLTWEHLDAIAHWLGFSAITRGGVGDPRDILVSMVRRLMQQERPLAAGQRIPGDLNWVAKIREPGDRVPFPMVNETQSMYRDLKNVGASEGGVRLAPQVYPDTVYDPRKVYQVLKKESTGKPDMGWRQDNKGRFTD